MENILSNQVKQLGNEIMNAPSQDSTLFDQLSGWLVGYVSDNRQIGDLQKIKILEKVAELQQ